jgi:hypothetical protein
LGFSEQHARYFPTEGEMEIFVSHLIEYFKHPCHAKPRKDEIVTIVRHLEDLHPNKCTLRRIRMWFQNSENSYRPVQIDDDMNALFALLPFQSLVADRLRISESNLRENIIAND